MTILQLPDWFLRLPEGHSSQFGNYLEFLQRSICVPALIAKAYSTTNVIKKTSLWHRMVTILLCNYSNNFRMAAIVFSSLTEGNVQFLQYQDAHHVFVMYQHRLCIESSNFIRVKIIYKNQKTYFMKLVQTIIPAVGFCSKDHS